MDKTWIKTQDKWAERNKKISQFSTAVLNTRQYLFDLRSRLKKKFIKIMASSNFWTGPQKRGERDMISTIDPNFAFLVVCFWK